MRDIVIGVDIGGTNTYFGFVAEDATILEQGRLVMEQYPTANAFLKGICNSITALQQAKPLEYRVIGLGIGAPNANYYRGTIEEPPNLPWKGVTEIAAYFKSICDVPTIVTNDANAAAAGELVFGAGQGMRNFIEVTIGTGLGAGLIMNGQVYHGFKGFAGELGHVTAVPGGRACTCGKYGCLEAYVSARGIVQTATELLQESLQDSVLRDVPIEYLTPVDISRAAERGDAIAKETFERTGAILGMKLADAANFADPEAIILFGGIMQAGEMLLEPTRRYFDQYLLSIFRSGVKVLPSQLEFNNGGVLGAAALVWNQLKQEAKV